MSYVQDEDIAETECPACCSINSTAESFLGALGYTSHHRCRYCGFNYTASTQEVDNEEV